MDLGIDFGSTYTIVSKYRSHEDKVESMMVDGTPNIPSVVSCADGEWEFGSSAKSCTGDEETEIFKAFKMLLPERDKKILSSRGFEKHSPYEVTAKFLDYCVDTAAVQYSQDKIENLVICAPEIWSAAVNTADGRPILRDICKNLGNVKNIQVISEPAAASAYFAYNYLKQTGKNFNGHILLIDYGGGTLDITLTKVYIVKSNKSGTGMEIKVIARTGAGENEEKHLGKAGVAYQEDVIRQAAIKAGIPAEEIKNDGEFFLAVDKLESRLRTNVATIQAVFNMYGVDELDSLDEEKFAGNIKYKGKKLLISYGDLVRSYNNVIKGVLDEKIRYIEKYMDDNKIEYKDPNCDNFKIALVGGFGNFYLVKNQVDELFSFSSMDRRQEDIIVAAGDKEGAISYGAALIASGVISIQSTAPYSVGIYAEVNGHACLNYAIKLRQNIEFNKVYYQRSEDGRETTFFVPNGSISDLIINMGSDIRSSIKAPMKKAFRDKLKNMVTGKYLAANVGFSLDESEVLSIHIKEYDFISGQCGETRSVELSRFSELLETSVIQPVIK